MRFDVRVFTGFAILLLAGPSFAQFNQAPNPLDTVVNAQRTLTSGTGTITSTGAIVINSGSTVPLLMSGTSTLINNGTIRTFGTGRAIDSSSGGSNLTITNNGLISSVATDTFRVNTNSAVLFNNNGTLQATNGGQAIDWANITNMSNVLNNSSSGRISAVGEDAVRLGRGGIVNNAGTISSTLTFDANGEANGGDGIDLRTFTGAQITNSGTVIGRSGIATDGANGPPFAVTITNKTGGSLIGGSGSGINIDGVSADVTATIINESGGSIRGFVDSAALTGDGDGIDVDGWINLTNAGVVEGNGARGAGNSVEGIAAGGGMIFNSGSIVGRALDGSSVPANGILIDNSDGGSAVASTYIQNDGSILGSNGFAIRLVGNFGDNISNAGVIHSNGVVTTIDMGGGNDSLLNSGSITRNLPGSGGLAVDLGAGDDFMTIQGGEIQGDITGGSGNDALQFGTTDGFTYDGVISDFEAVFVSGTVTLTGANTYSGTTYVSRGTLELVGANRLNTASHLLLNNDGVLRLLDAGGANGQELAGLSLISNATLDLGLSSMTFELLESVAEGASLSIFDWSRDTSPDYAIRFAGDLSGSEMFLALIDATTVNGIRAVFSFDGAYTNVAPVPLPAAAWLLLSGLAGVAAVRRRKGAEIAAS